MAGTWRLALTRIATFERSSSPRGRAAARGEECGRAEFLGDARRRVRSIRRACARVGGVRGDRRGGRRARERARDAFSGDERNRPTRVSALNASRRVDGEPPERGHDARRSVRVEPRADLARVAMSRGFTPRVSGPRREVTTRRRKQRTQRYSMPARARASRAVVRQAHLLGRNNEKVSIHPPRAPPPRPRPHSHRRLPRYRPWACSPRGRRPPRFRPGRREPPTSRPRLLRRTTAPAPEPPRSPDVSAIIAVPDHDADPGTPPRSPSSPPTDGDPLPPRPRDTVRLPEGARAPTSVGPNPHVPSPRPAPTRRHLGDGPSKVTVQSRLVRPFVVVDPRRTRVPSIAATRPPPFIAKSHPLSHHLSPPFPRPRRWYRARWRTTRADGVSPRSRWSCTTPLRRRVSYGGSARPVPRRVSHDPTAACSPRAPSPSSSSPKTHLPLRRRPAEFQRCFSARRPRRSRIVGRLFHRERARDSRRLRSRRSVRFRRARRRRSLGRDVGVSHRGSSSLGFRVRVRFDAASGGTRPDAADALALRSEAHATETRVRVAEHEYAIAAAECARASSRRGDGRRRAKRAARGGASRAAAGRRRFAPSWTRRCARLNARDARRRRTRRLPRTRPRRRARRWSV